MNKKIFAGVTALTLMISGVLCGCSTEKNTDSDESSASSSSKSDSVSVDNEKETSSASDDVALEDKIYTDYLSQQKLCTISKNFKILEAGTARDNPNGLAGAVKHDFDGDKIDELVTFTFEKNSTNGEDIRVDLLKVSDGSLNVVDSKYLTEMLDMDLFYSEQEGNTIYYSDSSELQIVQSEYDGQIYFGILLKEAGFLGGLSSFDTKYSVFTMKDNKIETEAIGAVIDDAARTVSYAMQIPQSISDLKLEDTACTINEKNTQSPETAKQEKANIDGMTVDSGKYNLFTNSHSFDGSYQIEGGVYESKPQAFSAMLNEFGLDIDDPNNQSQYNLVSKNQSEVKMLIQIEQIQPFDGSGVMEYLGAKLTLDSDLETLLNHDNLFTEPFADELALYEDILRYPYYYHEIWDTYLQLDKQLSDPIGINYCIADVNRDDKYEMVITGYADSDQLPLHCSVILPDSTTIEIAGQGETKFLDNGIVSVTEVGGAMSPVHYYDINSNTSWTANDVRQEDMEYIRVIGQDNSDTRLEGAEAEKKEQELSSGNVLLLNEIYYNIYSNNFSELTVVEDISEITCTWQKAYVEQIDEKPTKADMEYSLIYIDDNDIPELIIGDPVNSGDGGVYTYYNGSSIELTNLMLRCCMDGYIEKSGTFGVYWWWLEEEGNEIYEIENGTANMIHSLYHVNGESEKGNVYRINDQTVSAEEYQQTYEQYSSQFTEVTYCSYDEIMEKLNTNS